MKPVGRALLELLPALTLTGLGAFAAGALLGHMAPRLDANPGLLVMVPPLMALRGDIYASMGSRLGSAVHLGLLKATDPLAPVSKANVGASLVLSVLMGAAVGLLGWGASLAVGLEAVGLGVFVLVAVTTGLLSGFLLAVLTVAIVLTATRRGVDPDNVTGPLLTTVGDFTTLGVLFLVLGVLG